MNCPQCQTPNAQDSAFCANCGTQLVPAAASAPSGGYAPSPGQGTPVGYGVSDATSYGGPTGYGQGAPAGYQPAGQQSPAGYPPSGNQYQPQGGQYQPQDRGQYQPQGGGQYQPRPSGSVSPFQFDLKRLTRVDQIVGVASLITMISIWLPWFSASADGISATASGTTAHGWLWLVFVLDLMILAYLVMRAGWEESPIRLPIAHAPLLIVATGLQFLIVLIAFFDMPGNDGISAISIGWAWGAFIGLIAAIAAAAPVITPAVRSYVESRR
jgi:Double zinc ribbon